jgi:hypothetical protein
MVGPAKIVIRIRSQRRMRWHFLKIVTIYLRIFRLRRPGHKQAACGQQAAFFAYCYAGSFAITAWR